jgi:uncharacterized membrane protein
MRSRRKVNRGHQNLKRLPSEPFMASRERGKAMSEAGLGAVLLIIGTVMLVIFFWRQIIAFLLVVFLAIFCCGVYYIILIIENIIN